ncbi:MAG TPA: DUF1573 domain-containing protein [Planctomicrobium sp.]|nr:DUF1573 domain-containing protein [Planctomicrobium sp.]
MEEQPTSRMRSVVRFCLGVVGISPFLIAFCAMSWEPLERSLESTKPLSSLAFRQYAVNLREIPATGKITVPFSFWNRGRGPLEIVRLEPSCGCLAPKMLGERKIYGPGSQGLFEVQVDTAREPSGPQQYSVRVHYFDQGPREETVTFRLTVPERRVQVTPPELYFYQLSEGKLESTIRIADRRGKELNLVEVTSSSPNLVTEIQSKEVNAETTTIPVLVTVKGTLASGSQTASLLVRTDDPDFPSIRIPVFLHGKPKQPTLPVTTTPSVRKDATQQERKEEGAKQK